MAEPRDDDARQKDACDGNQGQVQRHGRKAVRVERMVLGRRSEGQAMKSHHERTERNHEASHQQNREPRHARKGRCHEQKLAGEDAKWRESGDRNDADHQQPPKQRLAVRQAADIRNVLRALELADVPDTEENPGFR